MENFKKEIWEKDNLDLKYSTLSNSEIEEIMHDIEMQYDITISFNSSFFIDIFEKFNSEIILLDINESTGLKHLISSLNLNILSDSIVNVIWNYNGIDQFKFETLQKYWEYIWYGPSDEMCLLHFPSIQLLLMITDYGTIYSIDSSKALS